MPNKNYEVETEHEDALAELVEFSEKLTETPDSIFEKITKEMFDLYKKKNADYGNSFSKIYDEFGLLSTAIRLQDKVNRLKTFSNPNYKIIVENESIRDTLIDIANYSIMTIMELEKHGRCSEDKTDDF
jgi:TRAP-type mannitol/chloroaromatic compound transport system substrate-binding protein